MCWFCATPFYHGSFSLPSVFGDWICKQQRLILLLDLLVSIVYYHVLTCNSFVTLLWQAFNTNCVHAARHSPSVIVCLLSQMLVLATDVVGLLA